MYPHASPSMNDPSTLDPDQLLEHSAWMRRLAERLVNGGEQADDLVQTAWAAALKNPPRAGVPM